MVKKSRREEIDEKRKTKWGWKIRKAGRKKVKNKGDRGKKEVNKRNIYENRCVILFVIDVVKRKKNLFKQSKALCTERH